jgi:ribosomal protein S18 acetylase RimI-like enzyme
MLIRPMQPHEIPALVRIYVETIKTTHAGLVSEQFLESVSDESTRQRLEGIFNSPDHRPFGYVCDHDGTIIGFAVGDLATYPPEGYEGELRMIYVLPAYHHMGVGRKLLRAVAEHFEREGVKSMFLGVFTNNSPARRFYEAFGGQKIDEYPGEAGKEGFVRYGWPSVRDLLQ